MLVEEELVKKGGAGEITAGKTRKGSGRARPKVAKKTLKNLQ